MSHICGVFKKFGLLYQKKNNTEYTNKLTFLAFKLIAILHNTLFAFADSFQKLYERCQQCVVKDGDYFESQKV
jgi:hypothetical protein